jgi:hypothetical protein
MAKRKGGERGVFLGVLRARREDCFLWSASKYLHLGTLLEISEIRKEIDMLRRHILSRYDNYDAATGFHSFGRIDLPGLELSCFGAADDGGGERAGFRS